jgi:hypothetical protein
MQPLPAMPTARDSRLRCHEYRCIATAAALRHLHGETVQPENTAARADRGSLELPRVGPTADAAAMSAVERRRAAGA